MAGFLKKQSGGFYLSACTVLAGILAAIFYLVGSVGGYYDDASALIVVMVLAGVAVSAALTALEEIFDLPAVVNAANGVSVALFMGALLIFVYARVQSIGFLLFSELGSENTMAYTCLYLCLASMAFMLIAAVTSIVCGFMKYRKS